MPINKGVRGQLLRQSALSPQSSTVRVHSFGKSALFLALAARSPYLWACSKLLFALLLVIFFCLTIPIARAAEPDSMPGTDALIGQMLMIGFRGTDSAAPTQDIRDTFEHIRAGRVGGVILFDYDVGSRSYGRNITGPEQLARLTAALRAIAPLPLFIAVDQEGGRVQRLRKRNGFTDYPSHFELGQGSEEHTRAVAEAMSVELARYGINLNFAPCADVAPPSGSPGIGALGRSFGADPARVARHSRAFAEGLFSRGVIPVYKHFPGHGSAEADSHHSLPDITRSFDFGELQPYRDLAGQPRMVMAGHLKHAELDPDYSATLSAAVISGLLRGGLGWDGVVITDDLQMRALSENYSLEEIVRRSVGAGVDILLFGNNLNHDPEIVGKVHTIMRGMLERGELSQERLRASYERILRLKSVLP